MNPIWGCQCSKLFCLNNYLLLSLLLFGNAWTFPSLTKVLGALPGWGCTAGVTLPGSALLLSTCGGALGISHVVQLLLPRSLQDVVDGCWKVVHGHLMEAAGETGSDKITLADLAMAAWVQESALAGADNPISAPWQRV